MSKYRTIETEFRNEEALIQALTEVCDNLGGKPVLSHTNDIVLFGYLGDTRPERVNFAVRRAQIGSSANDLGFLQAPDGHFDVIISEWDSGASSKGRGLYVLNQIKERYNFHNIQSLAWQQGYQVFETSNDQGETVLQLNRAY